MMRWGLWRGRPRPQQGTLTCASVVSASETSAGEALASCAPKGMPWPSTSTIHFVPFPRLVFPTASPPFWQPRSCRPGRSRPTATAGGGSTRPAAAARLRSRCPRLPTVAVCASRSGRWDTAWEDLATGPLFSAPRGCRLRSPGSRPRAAHGHPAVVWARERNAGSTPTAGR